MNNIGMERVVKVFKPVRFRYMKRWFSRGGEKGRIDHLLRIPGKRVIAVTLLGFSPMLLRSFLPGELNTLWHPEPVSTEDISGTREMIIKDIGILDKKLMAYTPKSHYMVINTASNEFSLYKGTQLVKKDRCSTGSYILLKTDNEQQWMFKTPKGEFKIQGKTTSPVWRKPDWAFIEQGLPVPPANHSSRFEYGVLGDYALSLGHGYLIHGTLYQRFIGLPVTHGCVRLDDENLELVYRSLSIGSKVYIY